MRFSKFLSSLFRSTTSAQKVIKPATKVVHVCGKINLHTIAAQKYITPQAA